MAAMTSRPAGSLQPRRRLGRERQPLGNVSLTSANSLSLPAMSAASITAVTTGATANLTLTGQLAASGTGTPVILATGADFINTAGNTAISMTGGGSPRWLIYSDSETPDGLTPASVVYNQTYSSYPPGNVTQSGNTWIYAQYLGTLDVTADPQTITYGQQIPILGLWLHRRRLRRPDRNPDHRRQAMPVHRPMPAPTTSPREPSAEAGYQVDFTGNTLLVNTKTLTVTLTGTVDKTYDGTITATLAAGNYDLSGVLAGDSGNITLNDPTAGSYDTADVGTNKTVSVSGLALSGSTPPTTPSPPPPRPEPSARSTPSS